VIDWTFLPNLPVIWTKPGYLLFLRLAAYTKEVSMFVRSVSIRVRPNSAAKSAVDRPRPLVPAKVAHSSDIEYLLPGMGRCLVRFVAVEKLVEDLPQNPHEATD
jgi:hypothetical protein